MAEIATVLLGLIKAVLFLAAVVGAYWVVLDFRRRRVLDGAAPVVVLAIFVALSGLIFLPLNIISSDLLAFLDQASYRSTGFFIGQGLQGIVGLVTLIIGGQMLSR